MKAFHRSRFLIAFVMLGLSVISASGVRAQDYPAKTVRIIVPLAAGGLADILARTVAQQMTATSGQSVVVENRPGGAGAIAGEAAARSPAGGHTFFPRSHGANAARRRRCRTSSPATCR